MPTFNNRVWNFACPLKFMKVGFVPLKISFFKYVKSAFLYHWNLLMLGTGIASGMLSGYPDIVIPLVMAGELIYIAGLSTRPRFQSYVDAGKYRKPNKIPQDKSAPKAEQILQSLSKDDHRKYTELKDLCLQLHRISVSIRGGKSLKSIDTGKAQTSGINRLLWIYLKLLHSKHVLDAFFTAINVEDINADILSAKQRMTEMGPEEEDDEKETKYRKSLMDTVKTSEERLENYNTAVEKHEFIGFELKRLHSKISSVAEMGINQHDPDFISSEIDVVSESVQQTEKAMNELDLITDLFPEEEVPPDLLPEDIRTEVEVKP